ncbi:MAG: S8/S53 family peptidase [Deltaproteobacteria bacterium]|nr:S8/S53 family peptidase [Deltaproteobacteria bacterium]
MKFAVNQYSKILCVLLLAVTVAMGMTPTPCSSAPNSATVQLHGLVPQKAIDNAKRIGRLPAETEISLVFTLPLRNPQELDDLLSRLYDPDDPLYGQYLTPQEFTDKFGPTQADYDAVADYATGLGFAITGIHPNRTLLDVSGSAATVNAAFGLHLQRYQTPDGKEFYAPDANPQVPDFIASRIVGVFGLDNAELWHAHSSLISAEDVSNIAPNQIGTGPGGGLTPSDIQKAYNLSGLSAKGSGQTLGLFELDGYNASDVENYVKYFNLPSVPLQNVLIDSASGKAGKGAVEVTLDIELQIALAPEASKIIVYEGPNSSTGVLDTYNRIATDNLAKQISTSWGASEKKSNSSFFHSENSAFAQMAAQGQSIYAASGDKGAYDNGFTLSVDDPASQPYVVGVGGTQLFLNSDGSYLHESAWNVDNSKKGGAGGGGISSVWTIPSWQQGVAGVASTTKRNVPDVSLNADQYSGYSIYYKGNWHIVGGTSCSAPLWAAFTACVNQVRVGNKASTLGFANPAIYKIASGSNYGADFYDIADGSTNLYYKTGTGYDNATGWGSFNGTNLLTDLTVYAPVPTP